MAISVLEEIRLGGAYAFLDHADTIERLLKARTPGVVIRLGLGVKSFCTVRQHQSEALGTVWNKLHLHAPSSPNHCLIARINR